MGWPDWGNVPSWFSAGSFVVAAAIYARDRQQNKKRHVEELVLHSSAKRVWEEIWKPRGMSQFTLNDDTIRVAASITNIGKYPVYVGAIAYEINFSVCDENSLQPRVRYIHRAMLYYSDRPVESDDRLDYQEDVEFSEMAVQSGSRIHDDPSDPTMVISEIYLTDYIGQRWRLSPLRGRRPRRVHWYHLRERSWSASSTWKRRHPWDPSHPRMLSITKPVGHNLLV